MTQNSRIFPKFYPISISLHFLSLTDVRFTVLSSAVQRWVDFKADNLFCTLEGNFSVSYFSILTQDNIYPQKNERITHIRFNSRTRRISCERVAASLEQTIAYRKLQYCCFFQCLECSIGYSQCDGRTTNPCVTDNGICCTLDGRVLHCV